MRVIEVKNLGKVYSNDDTETEVLRNISFSVEEEEFVAIMGPSGSGKSTLLHILGFLDVPTSGEYLFYGKSARDYSKKEAAFARNKKMGFVFQSFNLLPRTTVFENVKLPLLYSEAKMKEETRRALAEKAIEAVGLSHRARHEPSQLSGGEKQRVAIARALVNEPNVIFADEPTGNLDSASGKTVMEILQKLNREGHTIALITHEIYTAEYAERVIKIFDGEIRSDTKVNSRLAAKYDFKK